MNINVDVPRGVFGKSEKGDSIDFISEQEVGAFLWGIHLLLPEPHDQYTLYNEGISYTITNNYYGETGEEDTFVVIFFNYGYIGLRAIQIPATTTTSWSKKMEQIFSFILERARASKVPLVVADTGEYFSSFVNMQICEMNNIQTIVEAIDFDEHVTTYIISEIGLEKEHAQVEKRIQSQYCRQTMVVKHNWQ